MNFWTIFFSLLLAAFVVIALGFSMIGYVMIAVLPVVALLVNRVAIFKFVGEVRVELDKCSWPWDPNQTGFKRYKELLESTIVVIISVVLLAGFVTTCDFLLAHFVGFLTGAGVTASSFSSAAHPLHS